MMGQLLSADACAKVEKIGVWEAVGAMMDLLWNSVSHKWFTCLDGGQTTLGWCLHKSWKDTCVKNDGV
jgi:hypothetical protein